MNELKDLSKKFKPSALFLMETRAKNSKCIFGLTTLEMDLAPRKRLIDVSAIGSGECYNAHAILKALPAVNSDHCPLFLELEPKDERSRTFRYEAFQEEHKDCANVIKNG
ncbi:hypothetical protein PIB30_060380 [Stylosanthes scabra]|uniref:Uncharacterized protein n=1 Tax=Stylosanthes scabra TaxID=79078 RepID=A0ABU6UKE4_9FABA|nr:hypothetical protein [Stylosanthes scabra]